MNGNPPHIQSFMTRMRRPVHIQYSVNFHGDEPKTGDIMTPEPTIAAEFVRVLLQDPAVSEIHIMAETSTDVIAVMHKPEGEEGEEESEEGGGEDAPSDS